MSTEKSFIVSKALRGFDEIEAIVKADKAQNQRRIAGGLAAGGTLVGLGAIPAGVYGATQGRKGRKAAVGGRTFGRGILEGSLGGAPGGALAAHGMHSGNKAAFLGGQALAIGGAMAGATHGASSAMRNAQRRGDTITKAAKKKNTSSRANTDRYTGEYIQGIANRAQAQRNMGRGLLAGSIGATVLGAPAAGAALGAVGAGSLIASHANRRRLQNMHDSILIARQHGR